MVSRCAMCCERASTHKYSLGLSHEIVWWLIVRNGTKPWTSLIFLCEYKEWVCVTHESSFMFCSRTKWIYALIDFVHPNHLTESKMIINRIPRLLLLLLKCQHYIIMIKSDLVLILFSQTPNHLGLSGHCLPYSPFPSNSINFACKYFLNVCLCKIRFFLSGIFQNKSDWNG